MSRPEYSCEGTVIHQHEVDEAKKLMLPDETLDTVSGFFKVLGDGTRLRILWALTRGELCVCDISAVLGMTKSAVSHQLSLLRTARLVACRREGKTVYYSLDDEHVEHMLKAGLEHVHE